MLWLTSIWKREALNTHSWVETSPAGCYPGCPILTHPTISLSTPTWKEIKVLRWSYRTQDCLVTFAAWGRFETQPWPLKLCSLCMLVNNVFLSEGRQFPVHDNNHIKTNIFPPRCSCHKRLEVCGLAAKKWLANWLKVSRQHTGLPIWKLSTNTTSELNSASLCNRQNTPARKEVSFNLHETLKIHLFWRSSTQEPHYQIKTRRGGGRRESTKTVSLHTVAVS